MAFPPSKPRVERLMLDNKTLFDDLTNLIDGDTASK